MASRPAAIWLVLISLLRPGSEQYPHVETLGPEGLPIDTIFVIAQWYRIGI